MDHRRSLSTSQMFETDHDQNPNPMHDEHASMHLGRVRPAENDSSVFPIENVPTGVMNINHRNSAWRSNDHSSSSISMELCHWNSGGRSNEISSSSMSIELPHYQGSTTGPAYSPFMHHAAGGSSAPVPPIYADQPSSSHHQYEIHGFAGGIVNPTVGNGRGPCKRKRPAVYAGCERASTSRSYDAGNTPISSDLHLEKPQHWPRDPMSINPRHRSSNLSIGGEGSQRNVRSRPNFDLNLPRIHTSDNLSRHVCSTGRPVNYSGTVDLDGNSATATIHDWNHTHGSSVSRGRIPASDTNVSSGVVSQFPVGSFRSDGSLEMGGFHHGLNSSRNPVVPPHSHHGSAMQAGRGGRSNYGQRPFSGNGATTGYPRARYVTTSGHSTPGMHSRHSRPLSVVGWHRSDRSGSSSSPYERFHSSSDNADDHERFSSEGFTIFERSGMYSSRNLLDHHREMRLDIDNMSYEELLDLGERIGTVSTGLTEESFSTCLTESVFCSSDKTEESSCVICLEKYMNKEVVGMLTNCGHEYHTGCIRKWLSMKNVCPICKAPVLKDSLKGK